ncbi:hypothetical protein ACIBCA_28140 [Kitasatospora sp. NPDC051170]|uniref:hypothetical protein n=1 Tax=Kitasatospora sp. NPDC051170 TaxID=3364056 RepID=UPI0037911E7E
MVVAVVLVAGVAGGLWWVRGVGDPAGDGGRAGAWATAGVAQVEEFARVRVPEGAGEVRQAYRRGFQDDQAWLSFRLPSGAEAGFLAGLRVTAVPVVPTDGGSLGEVAAEGFRKAGAPDPRQAGALRTGGFVAEPLPGHSKRLAATVWVAAEPDGGSRVWVYAMDAP